MKYYNSNIIKATVFIKWHKARKRHATLHTNDHVYTCTEWLKDTIDWIDYQEQKPEASEEGDDTL